MPGLCQWSHFLECLSKSGFSGENAVFSELLLFWNSLTQAQLYKKDYQKKGNDSLFRTPRSVSVNLNSGRILEKWLLQEKLRFSRSLSLFCFTDTDLVVRKILSNFRNDSVLYWGKSCVSEFQFLAGLAKTASWARKALFWLSCGFLIHWHRLNCTENTIKFLKW